MMMSVSCVVLLESGDGESVAGAPSRCERS